MVKLPSRSVIMALAALIGSAALVAGCDRQSAGDSQPRDSSACAIAAGGGGELAEKLSCANAGEELPDFTFLDPAGNMLELKEQAGTPVLINLWATWCAPCVLEMPMLDSLATRKAGQLRVLTISQDMKGAQLVEPFFAERGFSRLEPWLDTNNDLAFHYGGGAVLPTTVLYDARGKEVWRMLGEFDWNSEAAERLITDSLAGQK